MTIPPLWNEVDIETDYVEFEVLRGFKWVRKIKLYTDSTRKTPLDLTGITMKLIVNKYLTLAPAPGSGIVMVPSTSDIIATLTAAQTTGAPEDQLTYYTELMDTESDVCPLRGEFTFVTP